MSTKIYYGYRMPQTSFKDLLLFFERVRDKVRKEMEKDYIDLLIHEVLDVIDGQSVGYKLAKKYDGWRTNFSAIHAAEMVLIDRLADAEKDMRRNPLYDFRFDVACLNNPKDDSILLILYTDRKNLIDIWNSFEEVEYYPYWSNTDPPENVSWEEWEARGEEWDNALKSEHGYAPVFKCLTFDALGGSMNIPGQHFLSTTKEEREGLVDLFPDFETRVSGMAKKCFVDQYLKDKLDKTDEDKLGNNVVFEWVREASKQAKTDEGKKAVEALKEEVRHLLPPINVETLSRGINSFSNKNGPMSLTSHEECDTTLLE